MRAIKFAPNRVPDGFHIGLGSPPEVLGRRRWRRAPFLFGPLFAQSFGLGLPFRRRLAVGAVDSRLPVPLIFEQMNRSLFDAASRLAVSPQRIIALAPDSPMVQRLAYSQAFGVELWKIGDRHELRRDGRTAAFRAPQMIRGAQLLIEAGEGVGVRYAEFQGDFRNPGDARNQLASRLRELFNGVGLMVVTVRNTGQRLQRLPTPQG